MSNVAVIVAAGSSHRMGFDKLTAELAGLPVLVHSLQAFERCAYVEAIVLVAAAGQVEEFSAMAADNGVSKLASVVEGGEERCVSVLRGIEAAAKEVPDATIVLIHDGARPLVSCEAIDQCIKGAQEHGAASLAKRVTDTLKRAGESGVVTESVERENLWRMETPQGFEVELILKASRAAVADSIVVTDEVSAVQRFDENQSICLVENTTANPKITVPGDLAMVEALLKKRESDT